MLTISSNDNYYKNISNNDDDNKNELNNFDNDSYIDDTKNRKWLIHSSNIYNNYIHMGLIILC